MTKGRSVLVVATMTGALLLLVAFLGGMGLRDAPSRPDSAPGADAEPGDAPLPGALEAGAAPAVRPGRVVLRGRIVDRRRRPVAGARICVRARNGAESRAVSIRTGEYTVRAGPRPDADSIELSVHATHEKGTAARRVTISPGRPGPVILPALVLGPAHRAVIRVTHGDRPVAGVPVRALFRIYGNRGLLGRETSDEEGLCRFSGLPEGKLQFVATTERTGRGLVKVELPREETAPIELTLPEPRPLRIRVLDGDHGRPVAGVTFEVFDDAGFIRDPYLPPVEIPPTDADGRTKVDGIGIDRYLEVRAWREGYPPAWAAGPPSGDSEWVIRLPPTRTVTWLVVPGLAPVPPDGAEIRLETSDGMHFHWQPKRGHMEGNVLTVPKCQKGYVAVYGVAPDGSIADLDYDIETDGGATISFRPPRTVRVRLRDHLGRPLAGRQLYLDTDGASLNAGWRWTDEEGVALWENVHANFSKVEFESLVLAELDLAKEDGDFDITLPEAREVVFRLTVAGKRALPERYKLSIDGETRRTGLEEDAGGGELRYALHPPEGSGGVPYRLSAEGYHTHWGRISLEGEDPIRIDLDLVPVSVLSALVLPAKEGPFGMWFGIQLQHFDPEEGAWAYARGGQIGSWDTDEEGYIHAADLEAGRYRFVHSESRIASPIVDLEAGERKRTSLDLSDIIEVSGRVVVPEGRRFHDVRVEVEGEPVDTSPWDDGKPGRPVDYKTGRFEISVPGGRKLLLRATHPLLACPEPALILAPRDDVVLTLVQAPVARMRIVPKPSLSGYWLPPLFWITGAPMDRWEPEDAFGVHLLEGPRPTTLPAKPPLEWRDDEQTLEFRVEAETTRDVLLDLPGLVPKTLAGVIFREGVNDLGTVTFDRGTTLRVEAAAPAGARVERIVATAVRQGDERYERKGFADDSDHASVRGLGPGTFTVNVHVLFAAGEEKFFRRFERTVSVDGTGHVVLRLEGE
ncbi:MAG: hypothetical protein ACYS99_01115 [Planctomycetota bacterium]|jgi:hypothetical protein